MIELKGVTKVYGTADIASTVLKDINIRIEKGEFIAIMGPSGSGKSTLLNILGTLDVPSQGSYTFLDTNVGALSKDQRSLFRRYVLGFIFQGFNLLKKTSALENVEMPLIYLGIHAKERKKRAYDALVNVGLGERMDYEPSELSGGQQQRVAIARAIVTKPQVLIADEPTGNLDTQRSREIMDILKSFNQEGITIIMVTHEEMIASYASRIIHVRDGMIEKETHNAH
ncbi:ABC transporter ATP-binding protein [Sulfurimonas sp. HSL-1716]|uniref:ABC transporter ATP-binding protein n=1 Tax=Hydrocurvibacter sulfurireducens TaxID=3131937 RepID=UPI0031F83534